jgi:hypothetical protein
MKTITADGDETQTESELARCPYCGGTECPHEVLWHARDNHDWLGRLPTATADLDKHLMAALVGFLKTGANEPPPDTSDAFHQLFAAAMEVFDPASGEFADVVRSWGYWISLADAIRGSSVVEVRWDRGTPAGDDTFVHAYFHRPDNGIRDVVAAATADVAKLKLREPVRGKATGLARGKRSVKRAVRRDRRR